MKDEVTEQFQKDALKFLNGFPIENLTDDDKEFISKLKKCVGEILTNDQASRLHHAVLERDTEIGSFGFDHFIEDLGITQETYSNCYDVIHYISERIESANVANKEESLFHEFKTGIEEAEEIDHYLDFYYKFRGYHSDDLSSDLGERYTKVLRDNSSNLSKVLGKYLVRYVEEARNLEFVKKRDVVEYLESLSQKEANSVLKRFQGDQHSEAINTYLDETNNGNERRVINYISERRREYLEHVLLGLEATAKISGNKLSKNVKDRVLAKYDKAVRNRNFSFYKKKVDDAILTCTKNNYPNTHDLYNVFSKLSKVCADDQELKKKLLIPLADEVLDKIADKYSDQMSSEAQTALFNIINENYDKCVSLGTENNPRLVDDYKEGIESISKTGKDYIDEVKQRINDVETKLYDLGVESLMNVQNGLIYREFEDQYLEPVKRLANEYLNIKDSLESIINAGLD